MSARIRLHDDGYGRLHLKWYADDSHQWHRILDDFKATFRTHSERSYSSTTRTWSVPLWCRQRLEEWADYWFDGDAQQWDDEEPAGSAYGRTYSNGTYSRYHRPQTSTTDIEQAYRALHLLPSAPAWAAEAVYKAAIKVHHPDVGGDGQTMVRINLAMETIREYQEHERKAS
jgi:hypothetical protein